MSDPCIPDPSRPFVWLCVNCGEQDVISSSTMCTACDTWTFNKVQQAAEINGPEAGYAEHTRIMNSRVAVPWRYLDTPMAEEVSGKSEEAINGLLEHCRTESKGILKAWMNFWDEMYLACESPGDLPSNHPLLHPTFHDKNLCSNELRARRQAYRKQLLIQHKYYRGLIIKFHILLSRDYGPGLRKIQEELDIQSRMPSCWWPTPDMEYFTNIDSPQPFFG